jgi:hypothetical protein
MRELVYETKGVCATRIRLTEADGVLVKVS